MFLWYYRTVCNACFGLDMFLVSLAFMCMVGGSQVGLLCLRFCLFGF